MTEGRKPSIAVVVLNWNGAADTIECLRSLKDSATPIHTIVVDNGSTDASVQQITASGLADVVVENDSNLGYAEGNNVGLRLAINERFSIVAVMNNDAVFRIRGNGELIGTLTISRGNLEWYSARWKSPTRLGWNSFDALMYENWKPSKKRRRK